jgi:hypothetical protein
VEKYRRAIQDTDDNIIWIMHIACFVTKTTNTHSEYVTLIDFSMAAVLKGTPLSVTSTHTLPVLLNFQLFKHKLHIK